MTTHSASVWCTSTISISYNTDVVNSDESSDEDPNKNNRMRRCGTVDEEGDLSWQRMILKPLEWNTINAKKYYYIIFNWMNCQINSLIGNQKGYLNLQFVRVVLNGKSKNQSQIWYYKAKDASKK